MDEFPIADPAYELAVQKGAVERERFPVPSSVRFDEQSGRILIEFRNGTAFMVPARRLQGLEGATVEQLADVELLGETGLHWESLDVDYSIAGLMRGIFGSAEFMQAQRRSDAMDGGQRKRIL